MNIKKIKGIVIIMVSLAIIVHLLLYLTDTLYVYKAIQYNFAGIDDYKIFENRIVKGSPTQEWNISTNYNKKEIPSTLLTLLKDLKTTGFLICKNDSIVYEKYFSGYEQQSISGSFSMAKSIVSILIGIALKEGKIKNLNQPVTDFVKDFNEEVYSKISLHHLLTMSSGLNWNESYYMPIGNTTEAYYGTNLKSLLNRLSLKDKPGQVFQYKSCDSQILTFVLQAATGETVSEYASDKLWKIIGPQKNAFWSIDHDGGIEKGFCCFNATARDFAKIGRLMMNKGNWNGTQLFDTAYAEMSVSPSIIPDENNKTVNHYGYQWWLYGEGKDKIYYARGILGQYIICFPSKKMLVIRLGKMRLPNEGNHPKDLIKIVDEIKNVNY